jgi:Mce-associated membrane protein
MRLLSRADTATQVNASDTAEEDDRAQPVDPGLINQAEAEALAAEELAAAARARVDGLRARAVEVDGSPHAGEPADSAPDLADAETGVRQESSAKRRRLRRPKLSTTLATIAVLASAATLAATGYMLHYHRQFDGEVQRKAEFTAAASQAVVTLMSIDGTKAEDNVKQIIANSAGQFRDDFQADAKDFVQVARESKAATKATVRSAAVESMTPDSAVVLVTAATTVSNTAGTNQQPRNWRLSVTMIRDGAQLKMSKVEFVP